MPQICLALPKTGISVPVGTRPDAPGRSSRPVLGRVVTAPIPSCSLVQLLSTSRIHTDSRLLTAPLSRVAVSGSESTAGFELLRLIHAGSSHQKLVGQEPARVEHFNSYESTFPIEVELNLSHPSIGSHAYAKATVARSILSK